MSKVSGYAQALSIFNDAKQNQYALPAINVINSNTVNACLESANVAGSPVIIQLSHSGAHFFTGKSLPNDRHQSSVCGAVAAAKYIHEASEAYDVPVLINTDHAARKLLPWVDGMLAHGQRFFKDNRKPLFTSHMIDLSEESIIDNIETCKPYLEKLAKMDMYLEIELGVTGGEEDGVDNSHIDRSKLYTQPEDVAYAYDELRTISDNFIIAASFGNVHGVYKPGNVKLEPLILDNSQRFIQQRDNTEDNPVNFVFHGGSGSEVEKIREAIRYGVVKMNIDTDIQWSFWEGVNKYAHSKKEYLQSQLGNPQGPDEPNKKYYDPRVWLREGEISIRDRLIQAFKDLNVRKD